MLAMACGDSSGTDLPNGSMSARVDGAQWRATTSVNAYRDSGFLGVVGVAQESTILFSFPDRGTGAYQVGAPDGTDARYYLTDGKIWLAGMGGTGTITLTSLTTTRLGQR